MFEMWHISLLRFCFGITSHFYEILEGFFPGSLDQYAYFMKLFLLVCYSVYRTTAFKLSPFLILGIRAANQHRERLWGKIERTEGKG